MIVKHYTSPNKTFEINHKDLFGHVKNTIDHNISLYLMTLHQVPKDEFKNLLQKAKCRIQKLTLKTITDTSHTKVEETFLSFTPMVDLMYILALVFWYLMKLHWKYNRRQFLHVQTGPSYLLWHIYTDYFLLQHSTASAPHYFLERYMIEGSRSCIYLRYYSGIILLWLNKAR